MITDIIIVAVIVLFAAIGVKRGLAKTILNIAGLVLTAISAYYLSSFLSQLIYDAFLKQTVINNIRQIIEQNGIDYALSNCLEAVPQWINGIISFIIGLFGMSLNEYQNQLVLSSDFSSSTSQAVENVLAPVVSSVFGMILLVIFFIIIFIIVKKLIKLISRVFNIPVVKQINQLLGGIFGLAEGLLIVFIAVNIFVIVTEFSNPALLNNELFSGAVFRFFSLSI
ncbi:MAG: CvpA family protein [Ruminococcus sp.]